MALSNLLPQRAVWVRFSSIILNSSAWPFSDVISWSSPTPVRLKFNGSVSATASISISGTLGGGNQNELVVVGQIQPQVAFSTRRWETVDTIASSSITSGDIRVEGVEQGGKPILVPQTLNPSLPCRLRHTVAWLRQAQIEQGLVQDERWVCYAVADGFKPSDQLTVDGETYTIENVARVANAAVFHHSELFLRLLT